MEDRIFTARLQLIRIDSTEDGPVFEHYHKVWTDKQATQWSLRGPCKTREDSRVWMAGLVPSPTIPGSDGRLGYLVLYRKETIVDPIDNMISTDGRITAKEPVWDTVGVISLLPSAPLSPASSSTSSESTREIRTVDLGYTFLPGVWGQGYATESVIALLEQYKSRIEYSEKDLQIDVQATVHIDNPRSIRVLQKLGFQEVLKTESEGLVHLAGKDRKNIVIHFKKTI